jgi:hypothetical protein
MLSSQISKLYQLVTIWYVAMNNHNVLPIQVFKHNLHLKLTSDLFTYDKDWTEAQAEDSSSILIKESL